MKHREVLKHLRKKYNKSQAEVAHTLGYKCKSGYSSYEDKKRKLNIELFIEFVDVITDSEMHLKLVKRETLEKIK